MLNRIQTNIDNSSLKLIHYVVYEILLMYEEKDSLLLAKKG